MYRYKFINSLGTFYSEPFPKEELEEQELALRGYYREQSKSFLRDFKILLEKGNVLVMSPEMLSKTITVIEKI